MRTIPGISWSGFLFPTFVLVLAVGVTSRAWASTPVWMNLTNGDNIAGLAEDSASVWVATNGGLVRIHRATGETTFYNRANSGLTSNSLSAVHVQNNGNVWVGMNSRDGFNKGWGLAKFDGANWTIYNESNSALRSAPTAITSDVAGRLWLGTKAGLVEFDGTNWMVYVASDYGLISNRVSAVHADGQGNIWIGVAPVLVAHWYQGGGLARFDGTTWTTYTQDNSGLPCNWIASLARDASGALWIASFSYCEDTFYCNHFRIGGLTRFDGSTWTTYDCTNSGLPSYYVYNVAVDAAGRKWISTYSGLALFDGTSWTTYNTANSGIPSDVVRRVLLDPDGSKWVGTYSKGLVRFDGVAWTPFETSNSVLPFGESDTFQDPINAIAEDRGGIKWLGLSQGGLVEIVGDSWTVYNTSNSGIPANGVGAIAIAPNNDIWIGNQGLVHFDRSRWTTYDPTNSGLLGYSINAVVVEATGVVWAMCGEVSPGGGVYRFDGSTWTHWTSPELPCAGGEGLAIDHDGHVWAGGCNGASRFDGTTWTTFLSGKRVLCLHVDAAGNVWAGTVYDGVGKFDGTDWTFYNTSNSGLPFNEVESIETDRQGNIWFGTCCAGLARFDGASWQVLAAANSGIASDYEIPSILVDRLGNTWIGGGRAGLSIYNPAGIVTGIDPGTRRDSSPGKPLLAQNHPNPFNPRTTISYELQLPADATLAVYDAAGRLIRKLTSGEQRAGIHSVVWDGRDVRGNPVASGVYACRLVCSGTSQTRRMVLLR